MYKVTINGECNGGFLFKRKSEMLDFISCSINNLDGGLDYDQKCKYHNRTYGRSGRRGRGFMVKKVCQERQLL